MSSLFKIQDSKIKLDVGGKYFNTSTATLTKEADSMLASMFSGRFPIKKDEEGRVFIDRDGSVFDIILDYLRDGEFEAPEDTKILNKLLRDVKYYGLQGMERALTASTNSNNNNNSNIPIQIHNNKDVTFFVIGGTTPQQDTNSVYEYKVGSQKWQQGVPMKETRCGHGVATYNNKVYVVGGRNSSGSTNSGEIYDPVTNIWAAISPMKTKNWCFRLNTCGDKLYALGGFVNRNRIGTPIKTMECYDPITDKWHLMNTKMKYPNWDFASTVWNETIILSGGRNHDCPPAVRSFDPRQQNWMYLGPSDGYYAHQLATLHDKIFSIGGHYLHSPRDPFTETIQRNILT